MSNAAKEVVEKVVALDCPAYASLLGALGVAIAIGFSCLGAGYATAKTGISVVNVCVMRPEILTKAILPVVMAGIIGLYGIIVSVVMSGSFVANKYPLFLGSMHLGGGLACGLSSLAAGFAIGVVGEAGVRGFAQQPRLFIGMILILIFAEVLGLYGTIAAIMLNMKGTTNVTCKIVEAVAKASSGNDA